MYISIVTKQNRTVYARGMIETRRLLLILQETNRKNRLSGRFTLDSRTNWLPLLFYHTFVSFHRPSGSLLHRYYISTNFVIFDVVIELTR